LDAIREHGPEWEHGGFYGSLDEEGNLGPDTRKSVIQQARHLWAFSKLYRLRGRSAKIRNLIDRLYRFLIDAFLDPTDGEFIWMADQDGQALDTHKRLLSNSFAILVLSRYALPGGGEGRSGGGERGQAIRSAHISRH
jgi:mannobiose 2-epimerase